MAADENKIREKAERDAQHKDPANWKLGFIYFNPRDRRLLPPKRSPGIGWTVNFASWRSILLFIVMAAVSVSLIEGLFALLNRGK
jgi:uncharacterized membrane protein